MHVDTGGLNKDKAAGKEIAVCLNRFIFFCDNKTFSWHHLGNPKLITKWINKMRFESLIKISTIQNHLNSLIHGQTYALEMDKVSTNSITAAQAKIKILGRNLKQLKKKETQIHLQKKDPNEFKKVIDDVNLVLNNHLLKDKYVKSMNLISQEEKEEDEVIDRARTYIGRYIITLLLLLNSQRQGAAANMTLDEYNQGTWVKASEHSEQVYVVDVIKHKN